VNLVYLYYDNPLMLAAQLGNWNSYAGVLKKLPSVILVDDGSPKTSAAEIVQRHGCELPIKVFRIKEDIRWNFSGARNLGCSQAKGWMFLSDIDMLLPPEDARQLSEELELDPDYFFLPQRVRFRDRAPLPQSVSTLRVHKKKFTQAGGYDEDYAGFYAKEDRDLLERLGRVARLAYLKKVTIQAVTKKEIKDASTSGVDRNPDRNTALYLKKKAAGFPKPKNPIRFSWERTL
jgi:hypothetical protein